MAEQTLNFGNVLREIEAKRLASEEKTSRENAIQFQQNQQQFHQFRQTAIVPENHPPSTFQSSTLPQSSSFGMTSSCASSSIDLVNNQHSNVLPPPPPERKPFGYSSESSSEKPSENKEDPTNGSPFPFNQTKPVLD